MKQIAETHLMTQYAEMKKKHPDAILLFRLGDFYEMFDEDAQIGSEILGITLTTRTNGKAQKIHLAGFPHHALDIYLPKLVRAGKRVAICEQLEDPKMKRVSNASESHGSNILNHLHKEKYDFKLISSLLSSFVEIINILFTFEEIRSHTQQILKLSGSIGISPAKAVEECMKIRQRSLFESI